jgi:hypothetical protein
LRWITNHGVEETQIMERSDHREKIVIFQIITDSTCAECGEKIFPGSLLRVEKNRPLCLDCADLGHLVFLPAGDAALTRRAGRHSDISAVVVKWSRARRRYERQGLLVSESALERAEVECLADEDARARAREREAARREHIDVKHRASFVEEISKHFPRCPAREALAIAEHACRKDSGRIGRSAAARKLSAEAIDLAVRAHIRHVRTPYDKLLGEGLDRYDARRQVADDIEEILASWRSER